MRPEASRNPERLVFALCHEVSNLLAASRLQAGLLDPEAGAEELAESARKISDASARAGSLLAQIRPLLSPAEPTPLRTDPLDVLDGLRRGVDAPGDRALRIELKSAATLPGIAFDPEALHHLLLAAVFGALDATDSGGGVWVRAEASGRFVAFLVEDDGTGDAPRSEADLCGRSLAQAVASAILDARGGRLEVDRPGDRTRVALLVPAASAG